MLMLKEIGPLFVLNLRSLGSRLTGSAVIVVSVASVVAVLVTLLGAAVGLSEMAARHVDPARVMVLSANAPAEYLGSLGPDQLAALADAPGVRRDARGRPAIMPMAVVVVQGQKRSDLSWSDITARGVDPQQWDMMRPTRVVEGRLFHAGLRELVVGRAVHTRYRGFEIGDRVKIRGGDWTVVGVASGAGMDENTIFADEHALLSVLNRATPQSAFVDLTSAAAFPAFRDALAVDPRAAVRPTLYRAYVEAQVRPLRLILNFLAYFVGGVMAVGATFATLNALFAAIETRRREIGTLRAIGFSGGAVVVATVLEAEVLCLAGAMLGCAVAFIAFQGHEAAARGRSFSIELTPQLMVAGALWAAAIALIAALAPAASAARANVSDSLRAA